MTSKVTYQGNLRTEAEHLQSRSKMITDAPVDNHGKGEAFSPTDTVATALASCMLTIMGIKANDHQMQIDGTTAEVTKVMTDKPRRISKIEVHISIKGSFDEKQKKILENAALTCPVYHSLHADIEKPVTFTYS
ncbi:OsmC family protein [Christiangramia portivictoriae]|uniref:OsmC family protein n=1 Tax=Christiangramia portivictoriae TaxID=326069 RepID=UPI000415A5B6|nr:OsmC family protein [Christiangramia portivictoriae]